MRSSAFIIANPAARGSSAEKIERASSFLREQGFDAETLLTEYPGHAAVLARDAAKRAPAMIIAAGGDGTINEVINGIVWSDVPLAILPFGTTNVLARELGIPRNIPAAMKKAVSGKSRKVSIGRIDYRGASADMTRYFCLMAGVGFDGKAVYDVDAVVKRISGAGAYVLSGLKSLINYAPERLVFTVDGKEYPGYSAIIGKVSRYGGNFRVTPHASLTEPCFYTCIFQGNRRTDLPKYVFGIATGRHLHYKDVIYLRSAKVEVRGSAHIQVDGDYLGLSPAKISVAEDALSLIW